MTGCPGWCRGHDDGLPAQHASPVRHAGPVAVQLVRLNAGDSILISYLGPEPGAVPATCIPVEDAPGLAAIFAKIDHAGVGPDGHHAQIAAAITACVHAARFDADLQRSLTRPPAFSRLADEQPAFAAVTP